MIFVVFRGFPVSVVGSSMFNTRYMTSDINKEITTGRSVLTRSWMHFRNSNQQYIRNYMLMESKNKSKKTEKCEKKSSKTEWRHTNHPNEYWWIDEILLSVFLNIVCLFCSLVCFRFRTSSKTFDQIRRLFSVCSLLFLIQVTIVHFLTARFTKNVAIKNCIE